jgi:hypothetical protein
MILKKQNQRIFLKCIEELNELSLELIHAMNKPDKNNLKKIIEEIKDVEKHINFLKKILKEME